MKRTCSQPDCDEPHHARGYCLRHHGWARRRGLIEARPVNPAHIRIVDGRRLCTVDGCDRDHYGKGMCKAHHTRTRQMGGVREDVPLRPSRQQWFGQYNGGRVKAGPKNFDLEDTGEL